MTKVKTITSVKPYNGPNGTVYYHNLIMDNGDKINIGKKKELQVGAELAYEIIGDKKDDGSYQQEYPKAKGVQPQFNGFKKSTNNVASFSLAYAKDLAIAHIEQGREFKTEQIIQVAARFNTWLKENS